MFINQACNSLWAWDKTSETRRKPQLPEVIWLNRLKTRLGLRSININIFLTNPRRCGYHLRQEAERRKAQQDHCRSFFLGWRGTEVKGATWWSTKTPIAWPGGPSGDSMFPLVFFLWVWGAGDEKRSGSETAGWRREGAFALSNFKALMWHLDINFGLKQDLNCFNLL